MKNKFQRRKRKKKVTAQFGCIVPKSTKYGNSGCVSSNSNYSRCNSASKMILAGIVNHCISKSNHPNRKVIHVWFLMILQYLEHYERYLDALSTIPFLLKTYRVDPVAIIWLWAVIQANLQAAFTDYKTGLMSRSNTTKVKPNNCLL